MSEAHFDDCGKEMLLGFLYADYTLEDRAQIGKYTAENGPARTTRHLSGPEMMARSILGKSVKFEKLLITYIFGQICQILYLSNFPCCSGISIKGHS